jgi:serine/threonine protein kinase
MPGTLKNMAPEQFTESVIDHRADIYALGVISYEMLCGCLPYAGDTPRQLWQNILFTPPLPITQINSNLPAEIGPILSRALSKQPQDRFDSAGEMALALRRLYPLAGLKLLTQDEHEYSLRGPVTSLGRNPDNTIVLEDSQVSRYHAVIRFQAAAWLITDQGSTNGTFINDKALAPHQPHILQPGDVLRLGSQTTLHVRESKIAMQRAGETSSL